MRCWSKLAVATLFVCGLATTGCSATAHVSAEAGRAAIWTAATVGDIAVLQTHDGHQHHDYCGHYRRWHDGQWTYYYEGRWEYYDQSANRWYYYAEAGY